jgi:hypothetical protein
MARHLKSLTVIQARRAITRPITADGGTPGPVLLLPSTENLRDTP